MMTLSPDDVVQEGDEQWCGNSLYVKITANFKMVIGTKVAVIVSELPSYHYLPAGFCPSCKFKRPTPNIIL